MPVNKCVTCGKIAIFANIATPKVRYCGSCKAKDGSMVDVVNKKCPCGGRAHYGLKTDKKPILCGKCAEKDPREIVQLNVKPCKFSGCETQPCFGYDGKKPERCFTHLVTGMVDVKNVKCDASKCKTRPTFGLPDAKSATKCLKHKTDLMVDLNHALCELCNTRASFGEPDGNLTRCATHKTGTMKNLVSKVCEADDCDVIASFGIEKVTHCAKHKSEEMRKLNVKKCEDPNCETIASFGIENPTHCVKHKSEKMKSIYAKFCENNDCDTLASFGIEKVTHCVKHKTKQMKDLKHKNALCENCGVFRFKNYKPYCMMCFYNLNPDLEVSKNFKTKENNIINLVKQIYPDFIQDKIISGGCSKRRPDGLLDCYTHSIILEVDENQHKHYDQECENKRIMEIFSDLGNRPLVIIRINPDKYVLNGKQQEACFTPSINGLAVNEPELAKRIEMINETIQSFISYDQLDEHQKKEINVISLCFDET